MLGEKKKEFCEVSSMATGEYDDGLLVLSSPLIYTGELLASFLRGR